MTREQIVKAASGLTKQLLELSKEGDVASLLSPANVMIDGEKITIKDTQRKENTGVITTYPGYSAPEMYQNRTNPSTPVYFVGAVMYTIEKGMPPQDAPARAQSAVPLILPGNGKMMELIDDAMQLDETKRIPSLQELDNRLTALLPQQVPAVAPPVVAPTPSPATTAPVAAESAKAPVSPQYSAQAASPAPTAMPAAPPQKDMWGSNSAQPAPATSWNAPQAGVPSVSNASVAPPKEKKSKKGLLIGLAAVLVVGAAFGGYTGVQSNRAETMFNENKYKEAVDVYNMAPWLKGNDMYKYSQASILMEEKNYEESAKLFEELDAFQDSKNKAKEAKYQWAIELLNSGKYEDSVTLLEELDGYSDSVNMITKIENYLAAADIEDAVEQYKAYAALGDFLDSADKATALQSSVYDKAIETYEANNLEDALGYFKEVAGFKEADSYIDVLTKWADLTWLSSKQDLRDLVTDIKDLGDKINPEPLLMSDELMGAYLEGIWISPTGGNFVMDMDSNSLGFDQLGLDGSSFKFTDKSLKNSAGTTLYTFTYVSFSEITVTEPDGTAHTFTRIL